MSSNVVPMKEWRIQKSMRLTSRAPGRARWRTPALHAQRSADAVATALRGEEGVTGVEVNPLTASVLVTFDQRMDLQRIEAIVLDALIAPMPQDVALRSAHPDHHDHHDHTSSPRSLQRDIIAGGVALAWSLAMRWALVPLGGGVVLTAVALLTARRYLRGALGEVREGTVGTDVLVCAGVGSALLTGEAITALSIVWLLNIGEYVHTLTLRRTRAAIRNLLSSDDGQAWLQTPEGDLRCAVCDLKPGDLVAVYGGERIPADGVVAHGIATIDEASVTGEGTPVVRTNGEQVWAGTIVLSVRDGFCIRVERLGSETVVGRLIQRVEEAEALRAPMELIGDRFARVFVPSAVLLALGVLIITGNVSSAISILLMACPCAVGLATPSPVSAAIGNAARRGILIKGGANLEAAATIDVMIFDKTGTLTLGSPHVARTIILASELSEVELLSLAATAIYHSHHPLSRAIVESARKNGAVIGVVENFIDHPGEGVSVDLDRGNVLVGSLRLIERYGLADPQIALDPAESVVYVAVAGQVVGVITFTNPIRTEAAAAFGALRSLVPNLIMLTGDRADAAERVADNLDIAEWRAEQSPEEKYSLIRALRLAGRHVAMIGDGINDAPSLASADLGIAMGTGGADVAIDAAGLTLASDDLRAVATTIQLSRETVRVIRQNYGLSFAINAGGVVAGLLGLINPLVAAILHNAGAIAVVTNSSRLIRYEPPPVASAIDVAADSCILSASEHSDLESNLESGTPRSL
jgi:cation-transporting P-type ATPase C